MERARTGERERESLTQLQMFTRTRPKSGTQISTKVSCMSEPPALELCILMHALTESLIGSGAWFRTRHTNINFWCPKHCYNHYVKHSPLEKEDFISFCEHLPPFSSGTTSQSWVEGVGLYDHTPERTSSWSCVGSLGSLCCCGQSNHCGNMGLYRIWNPWDFQDKFQFFATDPCGKQCGSRNAESGCFLSSHCQGTFQRKKVGQKSNC